MLNLKQLFCNHKFGVCGNIPCTVEDVKGLVKNVDVLFLECKKCGKRKTLKSKKI